MKRVMELDGIRGIAAVSVVAFHLAPGFAHQGWAAVDCFFVLSGYLITTILLANRADPHYFVNFYVRRLLRIWPIYYLTLLVVIVAYRYMPTKYPIDGAIIFQYLTYTQNIQMIWFDTAERSIRAYGHTWTLAIEEQFYMLWPLVVRFVPRRVLPWLCLMIAAGSVGLRGMGMPREVLPAHCDGFASGAILALIVSGRFATGAGRRTCQWGMLMAVVIAATAIVVGLWGLSIPPSPWTDADVASWRARSIVLYTVLFIGLIGTVVLNAGHPWLAFLRWRPVVYLGTISYGLYLYHIVVLFAVEAVLRKLGVSHPFDDSRPIWRSIVEMTMSLMVAGLSWRYIEQPILQLKSRFQYGAEPDSAVAPASRGPSVPAPAYAISMTAYKNDHASEPPRWSPPGERLTDGLGEVASA